MKMKRKTNELYTDVTNVGLGSISLPGYGILRAGKTAIVKTELTYTSDYCRFKESGLIAYGKKIENIVAQEKKIDDLGKNKKAVSHKPKVDLEENVKEKDNAHKIKKVDGDSEEDSDIQFVDIYETKRRIAEHPILGRAKQ